MTIRMKLPYITLSITTHSIMELTITLSIRTLGQIETLSTTAVILNYVMLTAKMLNVVILSVVGPFCATMWE
jgi:hypothetical protein